MLFLWWYWCVAMVVMVAVVVVLWCGSFCFDRELCAYMAGVGGSATYILRFLDQH
jgi:hypothetical protein